jgi:hypothetical protein
MDRFYDCRNCGSAPIAACKTGPHPLEFKEIAGFQFGYFVALLGD